MDLRKKDLLSWQNILNSRQTVADIEVLHGGISRIYISLLNKWKPCHGDINSRPHNFRMAQEKYFQFQ